MYKLYQILIALPILVVLTLFTALTTIICFPWKNSNWLHAIQSCWARSFCWLMFIPVSVSGTEHLVKGQSYVFVANHQSMFDVFLIYGWLPVIFKWLMKQELRRIPFVGTACMAAGHIFVDRRHARSAQESIEHVKSELVNGISTVIFPEGTRTLTGEVGVFKRGAFQIAIDLHLPVVPLSLSGCYEAMRKGSHFLTRHPLHLHIGEPVDLSQCADSQQAIAMVREQVIKGIIPSSNQ